jgi:phosphoenolpyruvate carboxylase
LVDDVEMRLARADMDIAAYYEKLVGPAGRPYAAVIRSEYDLTLQHILQLKGCARLLDSEPTLQRSIWLRNPYVDPIHLTQIELLRRWRAANSPLDDALLPALLASVNGIAQGLQGTG